MPLRERRKRREDQGETEQGERCVDPGVNLDLIDDVFGAVAGGGKTEGKLK